MRLSFQPSHIMLVAAYVSISDSKAFCSTSPGMKSLWARTLPDEDALLLIKSLVPFLKNSLWTVPLSNVGKHIEKVKGLKQMEGSGVLLCIHNLFHPLWLTQCCALLGLLVPTDGCCSLALFCTICIMYAYVLFSLSLLSISVGSCFLLACNLSQTNICFGPLISFCVRSEL